MSVLIEGHAVQVLNFFEKLDIICLQMMCSSNLAQTHVRDISLRYWSKIISRTGDISLATFFRIKFGSLVCPDAFPSFES